MEPETKVTRLGEIAADIRKKVTQLEEKKRPSTPPKMLEKIREATIEVVKKIAEAEEICAKDNDQVSKTWEALMDDEQSQKIEIEMNALEVNITQIRNDMKQLPLAQKVTKET